MLVRRPYDNNPAYDPEIGGYRPIFFWQPRREALGPKKTTAAGSTRSKTFEARLRSRRYPGLRIESTVIEDEDHLTVYPAAITHEAGQQQYCSTLPPEQEGIGARREFLKATAVSRTPGCSGTTEAFRI